MLVIVVNECLMGNDMLYSSNVRGEGFAAFPSFFVFVVFIGVGGRVNG